jgi:hypothetical protein
MLWLDSVLAVPAIGIRIDVKINEINRFQENMIQFMDYLKNRYDVIEVKRKAVFGYAVNTPGPSFVLAPNNIVAEFEYNIEQKEISGDFPIIEKPELKLYSEILQMLSDDIHNLFGIFKNIKNITYDRIGIVAKTNLSKESIPPGILTWIDYLGKPWGTKLLKSESTFFLRLLELDNYFNQCHHLIKFDETLEDKGFDFKLDWQRAYKEKLIFNYDKIIFELNSCISEAKDYFERFGAGELSYE